MMDSNSGRPMQRACTFCRKRKLRCDKQLPRCQSCIRLGHECNYIGQKATQHRTRTERTERPERTHVQELEDRLLRVESLLRAKYAAPGREDCSAPSDLDNEDDTVNQTTDPGLPLNVETIRDLEKTYFESIHPIMPIIHYERYTSCQTLQVASWPPMYLRYAIWALAATGSNHHTNQASEYYNKARTLTEAAAMTDPRSPNESLCRAQAWLHIAMYDMMCGRFALVWTSTSQAIRLLQISKVHNLDIVNASSDDNMSKNGSWSEAEEKRRAFWFAFCMDRSAFVGQGLPTLIDEKDIRVKLPALDKAYQSSTEYPSVTLAEATKLGSGHTLSPMSAIVVVYALCSSTMKELQNLDRISVHNLFATSDWVKRDPPSKILGKVFCVPSYLAVTKDNVEANLLFLNVTVHGATICVQRLAQKLAQTSSTPVAREFIQESICQCLKAASAIFELVKMASQSQIHRYHPSTFFCIYNALVIFGDYYLGKRDAHLELPIKFLIDFMKSLCDQNPIARVLFRDFQSEYPSLVIEFSSQKKETSESIDVEQLMMGSSQSGVSSQPSFVKGIPNESPVYDDAEEWASCVTESIPYDLQDALSWSDQVIDMNYAPLFRNGSEFNLG